MATIKILGARCILRPRPTAFLPITMSADELVIPVALSCPTLTLNYHEEGGYYVTDYTNIYDVEPFDAGNLVRVRDEYGELRLNAWQEPHETCVFYTYEDQRRGVAFDVPSQCLGVNHAGIGVEIFHQYRVSDVTSSTVTLEGFKSESYAAYATYSLLSPVKINWTDSDYIVKPPTEEITLCFGPTAYHAVFARWNNFRFQTVPRLGGLISPRTYQNSPDMVTLRTIINED